MSICTLKTILTAGIFKGHGNEDFLQLFIKGMVTIFILFVLIGTIFTILGVLGTIHQMRREKDMKSIERFADFIAQGLFAVLYGGWGYALFSAPSLINVFYHNIWLFCLAFVTGGTALLFIRRLIPELVKRMVNGKKDNALSEEERDNNL